jgi:serine/threonine protein kinase/tetratricopeptide (TPR) repeat protein
VNERDIFIAALEYADEGQRSAYLDQACAGDTALWQRLVDLLDMYGKAGSFISEPAGLLEPTRASVPVVESSGSRIGPYKLLQKLGEGGMGAVYMAEQQEPVRRLVAAKLIKPGQDSAQVLARFEVERQALALMDHPNIARVLDAGATAAGQPYFVMELIKGVPITKYCDENHLTPRERLALFVPVCQAVQHAHQKGIIHRDLKPSNVLVCIYDGKPTPKVIDFGVAKATVQKLTERTLFTNFGAIVGTLEYMSPEQAQLDQLDIDTRSDIYSLGVLLYELLTGTTPLERKRLKTEALLEVLRVIREEEPPKPSARLTDSNDTLASLSAQRQMEPARLTREVRGELDWIVMKCLDKDRARRYESANGLARDVERFLLDEPVEAGPPSASYKLRKYACKHRRVLATAAAFVMLLLAGVTVSAWQAVRATTAERISSEQATRAKEAELEALASAESSQRRLVQIEKANDILGSVFKALDPNTETLEDKGLRVLLGERLDRATQDLVEDGVGDPLTVAKLQMTLGDAQQGLGYPAKAVLLFTKARAIYAAQLGSDHPETLNAMNSLGIVYKEAGMPERSLPLLVETLNLRRTKLGPDHLETLTSMNALASTYGAAGKWDEAQRIYEETFELRKSKLAPDHPDLLTSMNNLAVAYGRVGREDDAIRLYEETLKLQTASRGPHHIKTLNTMGNLASAYERVGRPDKSIPLAEKTFRLMKTNLGVDHPFTLTAMNNLANAYRRKGKLDLALPLFEESLKLHKAKLGADHPNALMSMNNLALCLVSAGKLDLALPLYEASLELHKAKLGEAHPSTVNSMSNLASAYRRIGKFDLALALHERALTLRKDKLGADHPATLSTMSQLAGTYRDMGKLDQALALSEETLRLRRAKLGTNDPDTLTSMCSLAAAYWSANRLDKSIPLFEAALKVQEAKFGRDHADTLQTVGNLGVNYKDAGRLEEAIPLLEEAHQAAQKLPELRFVTPKLIDAYGKAGESAKLGDLIREQREQLAKGRKSLPKDSLQLTQQMTLLGEALLRAKRFAEAEPPLRECLSIRERTTPEEWRRFSVQSMLGEAVMGQKNYTEAESLLLAGYQGMKQREKTLTHASKIYLTEAIERLVQLYEATGQSDKAGDWRKKLPAKKASGN